MRATNYTWGPVLVLEANKFWFYAISCSLLISILQLLNISTQVSNSVDEANGTSSNRWTEKEPIEQQAEPSLYSPIFRQLIIDGCDLVIAGSTVGWIEADAVQVGLAYVVSSSVAGQQIWNRVQSARK